MPVAEEVVVWLGDNDELGLRVGTWLLERDAVWLDVVVRDPEYDWLGVEVSLPLNDCEVDRVSELLAEDDGEAR